jgi:hypothetical protein
MKDLKRQLAQDLQRVRQGTTAGHVNSARTGEFMGILVRIHSELNLDLRELGYRLGNHRIQPAGLRQPGDNRPITVTEAEKFLVDGDAFRTSLEAAIRQLDGYAPPKAPIGFVR